MAASNSQKFQIDENETDPDVIAAKALKYLVDSSRDLAKEILLDQNITDPVKIYRLSMFILEEKFEMLQKILERDE